ncbi:hypothetical protein SBDP2_1530003 [Syntrophobacter sp. SbD2]|nr:hypothetical protein SBDP2_1530003 [Syntrophobacter sp. SbD2]
MSAPSRAGGAEAHQMVRVFARAIKGVPDSALYADLMPLLSPRKRERVVDSCARRTLSARL